MCDRPEVFFDSVLNIDFSFLDENCKQKNAKNVPKYFNRLPRCHKIVDIFYRPIKSC